MFEASLGDMRNPTTIIPTWMQLEPSQAFPASQWLFAGPAREHQRLKAETGKGTVERGQETGHPTTRKGE